MKTFLITALVSLACTAFAQQTPREVTKMATLNRSSAKGQKNQNSDVRSTEARNFDKLQPGTATRNPADTVSWDKLTKRKPVPVKQVNYNELAK